MPPEHRSVKSRRLPLTVLSLATMVGLSPAANSQERPTAEACRTVCNLASTTTLNPEQQKTFRACATLRLCTDPKPRDRPNPFIGPYR
jgi:hypothetical protein